MNNHDPFQTVSSQEAMPRWMTITQASTLLGVPLYTVRSAVQRALSKQETWVKREAVNGRKPRRLIDTTHERYLAHARQWRTLSEVPVLALTEPLDDPFAPFEREPEHLEGSVPRLHVWPALRDWLCTAGLQIFVNALEESGQPFPWQWRWGELHGEGYKSEEAALLGAWQAKFDALLREIRMLDSQLEQRTRDASAAPQAFPSLASQKPSAFFHWFEREEQK